MELQVQVEKTSDIVRKLTIKVPAKEVSDRFQRGLAEVQRTAKIKGFRPGHVPLPIVKQYYGEDIRHQVFHNLIDESFAVAVQQEKLATVGRPAIDSPEHKTGEGEHDHTINDGSDLTYTATVEVLPDFETKGYTGVALTRQSVEVTDDQVNSVIDNLRNSQAELVPVSGGLVGADGKPSSRPVQKNDHVDMTFSGGIVTDKGIEEKAGMKGTRVLEVGSDSLIPGFEDNLVGMRAGETKTFRVPFPADFYDAEMAGKEAEFTVTINEVKEKKLPELNDEFAKQVGSDTVADLRTKAHEHLTREKNEESERKLRSDLIESLIEKTKFDVPRALVETQTRALAQDWAQELQRQGLDQNTIQQAIMHEIENLRKRAEGQVRASLILENIAKQEKIEVSNEDIDAEIKRMAESMKLDEAKIREFYANDPSRREDFVFRLRQERTLKFLLDKAKIKSS